MATFPKYVFLRHEQERDGTMYLNNYSDQADAIDGNGPTKVATYMLMKVNTLAKRVEFVTPKRRTRK